VFVIKRGENPLGVLQVGSGFPGAVLHWVTLPFYQVLYVIVFPTFRQDFLHFIFSRVCGVGELLPTDAQIFVGIVSGLEQAAVKNIMNS
jgi:hypothetical protein